MIHQCNTLRYTADVKRTSMNSRIIGSIILDKACGLYSELSKVRSQRPTRTLATDKIEGGLTLEALRAYRAGEAVRGV